MSSPSAVGVAIRCAGCDTPLAPDQRYCLECGERTRWSNGAAAHDPRTVLAPVQAHSGADAGPPPLGTPALPPPRAGNTTAVIAGVGVLMLAMGVGVLIGRASSPGSKAPPAQVVTVAPSAATGSGTSTTTGQTPATTTPSSKPSSAKQNSKKPSSSSSSSSETGSNEVGQTPSKPAPPSVAEHKKGEKGQSYEQKSKNLPNVISTG